MYKIVAVLYFTCFSLYVLFSRQPDYFDGVLSPATIHFTQDSLHNTAPMAAFTVGKDHYQVSAHYVGRKWHEGERTRVIYEEARPEKAQVYSWWGYWITWGEALGSVVMLFVLFQIAIQVTANPTPEALKEEQLMLVKERKRKYKD